MQAYVKCKNLTKLYPFYGETLVTNQEHGRKFEGNKLKVLNDLSFELSEGDVLGIIGLNGAGKSTLLKILAGVLKPSFGEVEIQGSVISILEQSSVFSSELTGIENLIFFGNILGYKTKYIKSKIDGILQYADLELFGNTQLKNYSSGMKIRLAFGLMRELSSDILILDEALSAGDQIFQEKIASTLDDYFSKSNIVLLATHDFREIVKYCNKCLVLNYGNRAFIGDVNEAIRVFYEQGQQKQEFTESETELKLDEYSFDNPEGRYTIKEDIEFAFSYSILSNKSAITPLITIDGASPVLTDSLMFRHSFKPKHLPQGTYSQSVIIPGNLLNIGAYRLSLYFLDEVGNMINKNDSLISLNIISDGTDMNEKLKKQGGSFPVRVNLEWKNH